MKKILVVLAVLFVLVCGCTEKSGKMVCTHHVTVTEDLEIDTNYSVWYEDSYASKIETIEKVVTEDQEQLQEYQTTLESLYTPYNKIEHYSNEITLEDGMLISTTKIDYQKIDTDQLIEMDSANSKIINNGKIKVDDIKSIYENAGCVCK